MLRGFAQDLLAVRSVRRDAARAAIAAMREDAVRRQLSTLPVARLRDTTQGGLRLGPLEAAGFQTVGSVLAAGQPRLQQIPGVGPQTARHIVAAARGVEAALRSNERPRFDPDTRSPAQTAVLQSLHAADVTDRAVGPIEPQVRQLDEALGGVVDQADQATSRVRALLSTPARRQQSRAAVDQLDAVLRSGAAIEGEMRSALAVSMSPPPPGDWVWRDYEKRAVTYNGLLIEVGRLPTDQEASQGFIPQDVSSRVAAQPLDTSLLKVSLRGYQAFGAKFALAQRRAMIGDEMGLGKTIEALAALCHLHTQGERHALVVCPASVLVNWGHEIDRHSDLVSLRLYGPDRFVNTGRWAREGGVAITTYGMLAAMEPPPDVRLAMVVVDEAHYVKNPTAKRTRAVRRWLAEADRALFLTGTPMENRVEEFRTLVGHLQPAVAQQVRAIDGLAGAAAFRSAVASVYLRRNQSDVLAELPPRIETQEWVQLQGADLAGYRDAVASRNFMAMRRAAFQPFTVDGSAKLARLVEIAEEAMANGRKVVVFSYFLDVLAAAHEALGDRAVDSISGGVSPVARQQIIDDFTARAEPAVLVSQIEAGGVGLNIQAASVVILCEPQWKPSTEDQAIARCHRMGQIRPVDVHRLLAEHTVDQRMLEIIARKSALIDEYVRESVAKNLSPHAVDTSHVSPAQPAVSQVETERLIIDAERQRLGIDEPTGA